MTKSILQLEAVSGYRKGSLVLLVCPMQRTGLEVLERSAVKVASYVLRGVGEGDSARLPDKK